MQRDNAMPRGALVISLDLELHWGVRDLRPLDGAERRRLLAARCVAVRIAKLFEEFDIHATWATVGCLFARSREELRHFAPKNRPAYKDRRLDPYLELLGEDEEDDPFHFAPDLIADIGRREGQEIASHSFSHYYCGESGPQLLDFEEDLRCALSIGRTRGFKIQSYVFPRNQVNESCLPILARYDVQSYRGTPTSAAHSAGSFAFQQAQHRRLLRLCDNYFNLYGPQTVSWPVDSHPHSTHPRSIPASRYLRPWRPEMRCFEQLRYGRIVRAMGIAASNGELFHLWWHPEDFALFPEKNLSFLRRILEAFEKYRRNEGMRSLSMAEVTNSVMMQRRSCPAHA
ncbi:MAG: polysaccharide deacetylase [Acidobacteriota bacterium]|nr:polysaccharide deacetylase [Acidobacteriota bacterium]